jgi:LmbE family N-acetylglucosaminyl deacetylase
MALKLLAPEPHVFVPDGTPEDRAFPRITHLGIGAHQDDLEFHVLHGILGCWDREDRWFGGVTCTDGGGSSRQGPYADYTDARIREVRIREQNLAAAIGRYGVMVQLGYPSAAIRGRVNPDFVSDLREILRATQAEIVYTHNPADKHETHVAVAMHVITAIRSLPVEARPQRLLGYEGWRGLDWLPDTEKVRLDVPPRPHLAAALGGVFDSQIAGGKRYDEAVAGRRRSNATLDNPYQGDVAQEVSLAMDMTPLIRDDALDPLEFTLRFVRRLEEDIRAKVGAYSDRSGIKGLA